MAVPASAHTQAIEQWGGHAVVFSGHKHIAVCDVKKDGWGLAIEWRNGGKGGHLGDANGSKEGCGEKWLSYQAKQFRLCRQQPKKPATKQCTAWKNT